MSDPQTIAALLAVGNADAPALCAGDTADLDFAALRELAAVTAAYMTGQGLGRSARIALITGSGPQAASAFITIAAHAVAAPLNPAYKTAELEFYLADMKADAVVIEQGLDSPASQLAARLNIPVLTLIPDGKNAGRFSLTGQTGRGGVDPQTATPDQTALILHTSGTTARPKMVPLSQNNLAFSAQTIARSLELTAQDRALNIVPLFHIHGLIAGILAPLSAGGSVYCTPGFDALKFFTTLDQAAPTWITAVPAIWQAILIRTGLIRTGLIRTGLIRTGTNKAATGTIAKIGKTGKPALRFIRSSSAALPIAVIDQLQDYFDCPLIEAYGMTEAAHQMTANPLPPAPRKPGSTGIVAGSCIAIIAEDENQLLETGKTGEIACAGPNVTAGYLDNPEANEKAFFTDPNGCRWLRTGDLGYVDEDHYLFITGRLKEIINRGGEKISPREVDEVLLAHDAVDQAVAFAVPHDTLGEEIAAAIITNKTVSEREIRDFAAKFLAPFKVPRHIIFVEQLPKTPTGKVQRIGLAKKLGLI